VLRINQRYFSSKKDSVEISNAYMPDVNLKFYNFSIYFIYIFVSGLMYAQEISASRFVELCLDMVVSETPSYFTHTHHTFSTLHYQVFCSHNPLFTCNTVMNRERPTFVEFCSSIPTCVIFSSMFFTMGIREFLHSISLLCQGKSKTDISVVV